MTQPISPRNNRFEAMYQRWQESRGRRRPGAWRPLLWIGAALLGLEVFSLVFIFAWYARQGVVGETYLDKFLLTRVFVASWHSEHPARKVPGHEFFGTNTDSCIAARRFKADGLLGWRLREATTYLKQPTGITEKAGWRVVNPQGFAAAGAIDFTVAKTKPQDTFRILFLGASSVEGDGAEGPLENLPSQFKFALDRRGGAVLPPGRQTIEVVNAGVGGYRIGQEYLYLISDLVAYQPDLVLSYSGYVDFVYAKIALEADGRAMDLIRTQRHALNGLQLEAGYEIGGAFAQFAAAISRNLVCGFQNLGTVFLAGKLVERSTAPTTATPAAGNRQAVDLAVAADAGAQSYATGLRLIAGASEIWNFRLAAALQPALGLGSKPLAPYEREMAAGLGSRELAYRETFQKRGRETLAAFRATHPRACIIDASQPFDAVSERVWEDTRHLLERGNRIVAELLVDHLVGCGLLGAQAAR